jgi:serine/threonine-protein kinase HipA
MKDMCQLTEGQTEHKYTGSHEQVAKTIKAFSTNPGYDIVNFYELVLFCFLTDNNNMHLNNFSLLKNVNLKYNLCPAYDLVVSELVFEGDKKN